jgi:hypothetical protein
MFELKFFTIFFKKKIKVETTIATKAESTALVKN